MPVAPKRPCAAPRCPALVEAGERYCPEHKRENNRRVKRSREDKKEQRFYDSAAWKRFRAMKLAEQPLCERHLAKGETVVATTVHHQEEIREGGAWLPSFDEVESLCRSCHSKEHGGW